MTNIQCEDSGPFANPSSFSSVCFQAKRAELEEIAQKVEDMRQVEQWEILHELYGKIIAWQQVRLQHATLPLACMADMIGIIRSCGAKSWCITLK